ncbi:MFS transporter [Saccharopolyspora pogona]|uniref:MFS transporter n=1 Tax=Saccharopolyspora pogona TaxID=333966 RepID=UPI0021E06F1A|nr:MFS transporter [Saccharopolyspora pogona]
MESPTSQLHRRAGSGHHPRHIRGHGLGTALPTIVAELGAQHWYSWSFTVFLAASAIGTVLGGRQADRRGPALPLLLALPTFAVGLIVAAAAHSILVLLVARVLQGCGGGVAGCSSSRST